MKTQILIGAMGLLVTSLLAADAKDEVKAAATKLADAGGYSWKTTTESGAGGAGGARASGPVEGKAAKDGMVCLMMKRGDNTIEAFLKGGKGAVKTPDGWQSLSEAVQATGGGGGQGGRGRGMMGRMLQNYKAPAVEAGELAAKVKELKKDGDVYAGDFTEEGAKAVLTGPMRGGNNPPEVSGAKGALKIWLKEGLLSKYEYSIQGKVTFNNNERDVNRTVTVEIKDVGKTTVEVPDEAKNKLS